MTAAGFGDDRCRFSPFDNSAGNLHDPYTEISDVIANGPEPYVVFCHQDVRTDLGRTCDELLERLRDLTRRHPRWAVAGTAGVDRAGDRVLCLNDPYGSFRHDDLPRSVVSLDENFLIFRRSHALALSPELSGFHLYGTDACLQAYRRGWGAYVIDFPVTHLSAGDAESQSFRTASRNFAAAWRRRLLIGLIRTTCTDITISRFGAVERLLKKERMAKLMRRLRRPVVTLRI